MAKSIADQLKEAQAALVTAEAKTTLFEEQFEAAKVAADDASSRAASAEQELEDAMDRATQAASATLTRTPKPRSLAEHKERHGPGRVLLARKAGGANGKHTRLKYAWNARKLVREECHGDLGHVSGTVLTPYTQGQTVLNPVPEDAEPLPEPTGALNAPPASPEGSEGGGEG